MSGLPERTLADFELATTTPRKATVAKLAVAFRDAGIAFVQVPGSTGGVILLDHKA